MLVSSVKYGSFLLFQFLPSLIRNLKEEKKKMCLLFHRKRTSRCDCQNKQSFLCFVWHIQNKQSFLCSVWHIQNEQFFFCALFVTFKTNILFCALFKHTFLCFVCHIQNKHTFLCFVNHTPRSVSIVYDVENTAALSQPRAGAPPPHQTNTTIT